MVDGAGEFDREKALPSEGLVRVDGVGLVATLVAGLELERERQGLTKAAVAERMGVPGSRFTDWSTGKVRPGVDVIERWLLALDLRVHLLRRPAGGGGVEPADLDDETLARVLWAVRHKSRNVAKAQLSRGMPDGVFATAADLDVVLGYVIGHPRIDEFEAMVEANAKDYEKK